MSATDLDFLAGFVAYLVAQAAVCVTFTLHRRVTGL